MRLKHSAAIALVSLCLPLTAGGDWAPVTPEIWQMKASDPGNELGAVFLMDRNRLGPTDIECTLRIRIMSEAGKAAAQLAVFSSNLYQVEGRTVYPDGKSIAFDSTKDFAEQTVKSGWNEEARKVLVPPGVTSDCVVDLHWVEQGSVTYQGGDRGITDAGAWQESAAVRPYPIRHFEVQILKRAERGFAFVGFGGRTPKIEDSGAYKVYTFEDLPAYEDIPYSLPCTRERASLCVFEQPEGLQAPSRDPKTYWSYWAAHQVPEWWSADLKKGGKYKDYLAEFRNGLPADPIQQAAAVVAKIHKDILNINTLTAEQAKTRTKAQSKTRIPYGDMDFIASERWGDTWHIKLLTFQILKDLGLKPRLIFAVDRNRDVYRPDVASIWQFSDLDTFVGVPSADYTGMAWFDPGCLLLPLGAIPANYQGTPALQVDPIDWSSKQVTVPVQGASMNQSAYSYELTVAEGRESFKTEAAFTGGSLFQVRDRYYRLEPSEQEKLLKESFEGVSGGYQIESAAVRNAQDLAKVMTLAVQGKKDLDEGRKLEVYPFPGMPITYRLPDAWPATRSTPIILPLALKQTAVCRLHVPVGYQVVVDDNLQEQNAFGAVSWKTTTTDEGNGKLVTIEYKVQAAKTLAGAQEYESFKAFLGWVEHAYTRTVNLLKVR